MDGLHGLVRHLRDHDQSRQRGCLKPEEFRQEEQGPIDPLWVVRASIDLVEGFQRQARDLQLLLSRRLGDALHLTCQRLEKLPLILQQLQDGRVDLGQLLRG